MSEGISHASIRFKEGGRLQKKKNSIFGEGGRSWRVKVSLFLLIGFCFTCRNKKRLSDFFFRAINPTS